mmetsp:Transcript_10973/g.26451  ORF Transcript_10973/g.26451 Transcript_10973/m.26451 type:complete len:331 (+) Transcript_10973:137-1129(+)
MGSFMPSSLLSVSCITIAELLVRPASMSGVSVSISSSSVPVTAATMSRTFAMTASGVMAAMSRAGPVERCTARAATGAASSNGASACCNHTGVTSAPGMGPGAPGLGSLGRAVAMRLGCFSNTLARSSPSRSWQCWYSVNASVAASAASRTRFKAKRLSHASRSALASNPYSSSSRNRRTASSRLPSASSKRPWKVSACARAQSSCPWSSGAAEETFSSFSPASADFKDFSKASLAARGKGSDTSRLAPSRAARRAAFSDMTQRQATSSSVCSSSRYAARARSAHVTAALWSAFRQKILPHSSFASASSRFCLSWWWRLQAFCALWNAIS